MPTSGTGQVLKVVQSFSGRGARTNPYLLQLVRALPESVASTGFSWRQALLGRYDVLHVHWPEVLLRGTSRAKTTVRCLLFAAVLLRTRVSGIAVVRTLHNLRPHEQGSWLEELLLQWCDRCTDTWIALSRVTPVPEGRSEVIPHGHYRAWFAGLPQPAPVRGRLLFFGLLRPYKGLEALLSAFMSLDDDQASLRVVGRPETTELDALVRQACASDPRISARLDYLPDAELAQEVGAAQVVVLPIRDLLNSGTALLGLSLGRRLLVPATPATQELAQEVGVGWVSRFEGDLRPADLSRALLQSSSSPDAEPDLQARDWTEVGRRHAEVYQEAAAGRTPRRSRPMARGRAG